MNWLLGGLLIAIGGIFALAGIQGNGKILLSALTAGDVGGAAAAVVPGLAPPGASGAPKLTSGSSRQKQAGP